MRLQECLGQGICNAAAGTCSCFPGYAGAHCEQCAPGFHLSMHGTCDRIQDPCQSSATPCEGGCSGNGSCVDGRCDCAPGFYGRECATKGCPEEWSEEDCAACPSGVIDKAGKCCEAGGREAPALDGEGECCASGTVDVCGRCNGGGVAVDKYGKCCPVRCRPLVAAVHAC